MAIVKNSISVKLGKYELFGSAVQITERRRTPAIKQSSEHQDNEHLQIGHALILRLGYRKA